MSFDAGAATGRLELDSSDFTGGIMEAEGIARIFPEVVTDFIANPLLGVAEIFKELGETAIDTFTEVTNDAESMGLLSARLGVKPEIFSQWSQLAKTVHVAPEQLAMGVKMLEEEAAKALEGEAKFNAERQARREKAFQDEAEFEEKHRGKSGDFYRKEQEWEAGHQATNAQAAAFARLGITLNDLRDNLNDPMALFQRIKDAIDAVPDPIERMRLATELLGARQSALVPVLTMSKEHVEEFAKATEQMGGITTTSETKAAQAFTDLQTEAGIALEGIKKSAMMPILDYITAHKDRIQQEIVHLSQVAIEDIGKIWKYLSGPEGKTIYAEIVADIRAIPADLSAIGAELKKIYDDWIKPIFDRTKEIVGNLSEMRGGKMPNDQRHDAVSDALGYAFSEKYDPNGQYALNLTPEARATIEHTIKERTGITVPAGTTDAELGKLTQRAMGEDRGNPFSSAAQVTISTMHVYTSPGVAQGGIDQAVQAAIKREQEKNRAMANSTAAMAN